MTGCQRLTQALHVKTNSHRTITRNSLQGDYCRSTVVSLFIIYLRHTPTCNITCEIIHSLTGTAMSLVNIY